MDFESLSSLDTEFVEGDPAVGELADEIGSVGLDSPLLGSSLSSISYMKPRRKSNSGEPPSSAHPENKALPEGFMMIPEYPVFKGEPLNKAPNSVLVKQSTLLLIALGPL